jgi:hypothetical protein
MFQVVTWREVRLMCVLKSAPMFMRGKSRRKDPRILKSLCLVQVTKKPEGNKNNSSFSSL